MQISACDCLLLARSLVWPGEVFRGWWSWIMRSWIGLSRLQLHGRDAIEIVFCDRIITYSFQEMFCWCDCVLAWNWYHAACQIRCQCLLQPLRVLWRKNSRFQTMVRFLQGIAYHAAPREVVCEHVEEIWGSWCSYCDFWLIYRQGLIELICFSICF